MEVGEKPVWSSLLTQYVGESFVPDGVQGSQEPTHWQGEPGLGRGVCGIPIGRATGNTTDGGAQLPCTCPPASALLHLGNHVLLLKDHSSIPGPADFSLPRGHNPPTRSEPQPGEGDPLSLLQVPSLHSSSSALAHLSSSLSIHRASSLFQFCNSVRYTPTADHATSVS